LLLWLVCHSFGRSRNHLYFLNERSLQTLTNVSSTLLSQRHWTHTIATWQNNYVSQGSLIIFSQAHLSYASKWADGNQSSTTRGNGALTIWKAMWSSGFFFPPNQLCAKFSLLFLYRRIFGIRSIYNFWIKAIAALQTCLFFATMFVNAFQCRPVSKYWDVLNPDGSCLNVPAYLVGAETINSLIDIAMAALAVYMLRDLRVSLGTKWKLSIVFAIGGLWVIFRVFLQLRLIGFVVFLINHVSAGIIGFIKIGLAIHVTVRMLIPYLRIKTSSTFH